MHYVSGRGPGQARATKRSGMKAMTVLALAVMMTLGACNTVDGIGRDISDTANTVGGWF